MRALRFVFLVLVAKPNLHSQSLLKYLDWTPQTRACCMAVDADGNAFIAGRVTTASSENGQVVHGTVTKLDRNNEVIYTFNFSEDGPIPSAVKPDSQGNLFVGGGGFLAKIDPSGTQLLFSIPVSGTIYAIAVDQIGNVLLTGSTGDPDFPVTPDAYQSDGPVPYNLGDPTYAFLTKISSGGDRILYSTFLGTPEANCTGGSRCIGVVGHTYGRAIVVDNDGTIIIGGSTSAYRFPRTPGAFQSSCCYGSTGFVTRFSPDGTAIVWSTFLGRGNSIASLALGMDGSVVAAGEVTRSDFPVTAGAFQTSFAALHMGLGVPTNTFLSKLDPTGSTLIFSTFLGGSIREQFGGMQLDSQDRPWITGTTLSPDFPGLSSSLKLGNTFVAGLSTDGSSLVSSNQFPNGAAGTVIALDRFGDQIVLGKSGSLLRIPPTGLSGASVVGQANAAGYSVSNRVSPGEIISLYGTGLGPNPGVGAQIDSEGRLTKVLGGVEVLFDGNPAPLHYVSENQINVIVPFQVAEQVDTLLQVRTISGSSEIIPFRIVDADPQIFPVFPTYPDRWVAGLNEDNTLNSPGNPAAPCSVVTVWAHGVGLFAPSVSDGSISPLSLPLPVPLSPLSMMVDARTPIRRQPAEILYAGAAPGMVAGVIQINFRLREAQSSEYPIQLMVGNKQSEILEVHVQRGACT